VLGEDEGADRRARGRGWVCEPLGHSSSQSLGRTGRSRPLPDWHHRCYTNRQ
jgi:hypothetical protein